METYWNTMWQTCTWKDETLKNSYLHHNYSMYRNLAMWNFCRIDVFPDARERHENFQLIFRADVLYESFFLTHLTWLIFLLASLTKFDALWRGAFLCVSFDFWYRELWRSSWTLSSHMKIGLIAHLSYIRITWEVLKTIKFANNCLIGESTAA